MIVNKRLYHLRNAICEGNRLHGKVTCLWGIEQDTLSDDSRN